MWSVRPRFRRCGDPFSTLHQNDVGSIRLLLARRVNSLAQQNGPNSALTTGLEGICQNTMHSFLITIWSLPRHFQHFELTNVEEI
jgi:hypothetical protein